MRVKISSASSARLQPSPQRFLSFLSRHLTSKGWFARWAAIFRVGRGTSGSAKPRLCWTVSISGFGVAYALPPVNNGGQGRRDTLDCGSWVSVTTWRPVRLDISGDRGGLAEHRLSPMSCRPLTSKVWEFLFYAAHPMFNPTESPCTDPYARSCDRESE